MATDTNLLGRGFTRCAVAATRVNIAHPDPHELGPFCRLAVDDTAPDLPGVYAWVVDMQVMYVGKAGRLRTITQGARIGRPYNDYTYVPRSQVHNASDPRVRVNGLVNAAACRAALVEWWWLAAGSIGEAAQIELHLIDSWQPPWNRMGIRSVPWGDAR